MIAGRDHARGRSTRRGHRQRRAPACARWAAAIRRTWSTSPAGGSSTFALGRSTSFAPDLSDPRSLGEAWFYVPSATPGRIWNILLRRGDPATQVHFRGVREVTVDGRATFARRARVPGWPLARGRRRARAAATHAAGLGPGHRAGRRAWPACSRWPCAARWSRRARRAAAGPSERHAHGHAMRPSAGRSSSPTRARSRPTAAAGDARARRPDRGGRRRARGRSQLVPGARTARDYAAARVGVERLAVLQRGRRDSSARGGPGSPRDTARSGRRARLLT